MRIRNMPRFAGNTLTVALASRVSNSIHVGAVAVAEGQWIVNGWRDMHGNCHTDHAAECAMLQQARVLNRLFVAAGDQRYMGNVTVLTAVPDVEKLLFDWRNGHNPQFPWYKSDLQNPRRLVQRYVGRLTVMTLETGDRPLIGLACGLADLAFDGMSGLRDRVATAHQARRLVADWRKAQ